MDKSLAGLIGAVGALAASGPALAASSADVQLNSVMQANSYADLLKPIPNATALRAEFRASRPAPESDANAGVVLVQDHHHHHHHHHHAYVRRYVPPIYYPRPRPHHHHHHHHHQQPAISVIIP